MKMELKDLKVSSFLTTETEELRGGATWTASMLDNCSLECSEVC